MQNVAMNWLAKYPIDTDLECKHALPSTRSFYTDLTLAKSQEQKSVK
jgi:hypothetical protein